MEQPKSKEAVNSSENDAGKPEAAQKQNSSAPQKPQWMTVYTDYGYGQVDAQKFLQQVQECEAKHAEAQQPILEYFKARHAELKAAHEAQKLAKAEELENSKAEQSSAAQSDSAAASDGQNKVEQAAAASKEGDEAKPDDSAKESAAGEAKKEEDEQAQADKKKEEALAATRKLLEQIQLTDEHKATIRDIYEKIVHVKFRWGGEGFIQRRLVSQHITINVKTLHGARKKYTFTVSIFDKVSKIRDKLSEAQPDEFSSYSQPKFVFPQGKIRILELEDVIEKVQLTNNCTLVLMGIRAFCWDKHNMCSGIKLEQKEMRAVREKCSDNNHRTVLATVGHSRGRHYWEITVQAYEGNTSTYIGICKKQDAPTLAELRDTYGLLIPENKKFLRPPESGNYTLDRKTHGEPLKNGDVLGVLLEFDNNRKGSLTFFRNGACMGQLFKDIVEGEYYPCVSMNHGNNQVLLSSRPQMPEQPYVQMQEEEE